MVLDPEERALLQETRDNVIEVRTKFDSFAKAQAPVNHQVWTTKEKLDRAESSFNTWRWVFGALLAVVAILAPIIAARVGG